MLSVLLLIGLIVVGLYLKWQDMNTWEVIFETTGNRIGDAQGRFAYLKNRGIRCRLKTRSPRAMSSRGGAGVNPLMMTSSRVEVHQDDLDQARYILKDYEESCS